jgi:hypothetical protein
MHKRITLAFLVIAFSARAIACEDAPLAPGAEYKPTAERAVVLVAFKGDKKFIWLGQPGVETKWVLTGEQDTVVALPVKVGTEFTVSTLGIKDAFATVDKAHTLTIARSGIYYYGILRSKGLQVSVMEEQSKEHIDSAKKQFAGVFKVLQPVNFQ